MKKKLFVNTIAATFLLITLNACETQSIKKVSSPQSENDVNIAILNFENVPVDKIPEGWKIENTNLKGQLPTWKVIKNNSAPSREKVLALTNTKQSSGDSFNLCWTKNISLLDGEVEVELKSVKGEEDQGGGVIWRVLDKNNYYIARYNPLEDNYRIYYVKNGKRQRIKNADIKLPRGKWDKLKIIQRGNIFECYLNDKKLFEGTDDTFTKAGGVGLWTKADAVTSFDNFTITPYSKVKK